MGFLVGMLASPLNTQHAHVTSVEELVALSVGCRTWGKEAGAALPSRGRG